MSKLVEQVETVSNTTSQSNNTQNKADLYEISESLWILGQTLKCCPVFASGYHTGYRLSVERLEGGVAILTDYEFTRIINQYMPSGIPDDLVDEWRSAFIYGWVIGYHCPVPENELVDFARMEQPVNMPTFSACSGNVHEFF